MKRSDYSRFLIFIISFFIIITPFLGYRNVESAISWAEGEIGDNWDEDEKCNHPWAYWCLHFVGHAYGLNPAGFPNAISAWQDDGNTFSSRQISGNPPRGALVFFEATANNLWDGHVGLSIGNRMMIHAWSSGVRKDFISFAESTGAYLGWRWPSGWTPDNPVYPTVGDSDGNGIDDYGYYEDNVFYLGNGQIIPFGISGDYPVIGDWNRDGRDEIGVFRSKEPNTNQSTFYIDLDNNGIAEKSFSFGFYPQDLPLVGDWDGDGDEDIGRYDPPNSTFYLYHLDLNSSTTTLFAVVAFGQPNDIPIVGDWDGDRADDLGVFRIGDPNPNTNNFYFDLDLTGGSAEKSLADFGYTGYGNIEDIPVIGDWDGDGDDNIGVYRPSNPGIPFVKFYIDSLIPSIVTPHQVTIPGIPNGPTSGGTFISYKYSTRSSNCSQEHTVEYQFDWGDGTFSTWSILPNASHSWLSIGTYSIKARARCRIDTQIVSYWSSSILMAISSSPLPSTPSNPSPSDWATNISININLDWGECPGVTSYDVYFGSAPAPPKIGTVASSWFDLGKLNYNNSYYWKIVAKNAYGEAAGPEWHFSTQANKGSTMFYYEDSANLYSLDSDSLAETLIGAIGYGGVTDIAFSPDEELYGCRLTFLIKIDPVAGTGNLVGNVGYSINALAFDKDGHLYGATQNGEFISIDKSTGIGTYLGSFGNSLYSSGDLVFSQNDTLYGTAKRYDATNDLLVRINSSSGKAYIIGNIGFVDVFGLAFDEKGCLYGFTDNKELLIIDLATGSGSLIDNLNYNAWGAASRKAINVNFPIFDGHDFDGNSRSDISVWRPSNGIWFLKDIANPQYGTAGDIPVNGDYDGNSITDVAVWRPSNGVWFVKNQSTVQWGTNGDIPVPGKYDSDNKTDIAVWRPSTGYWFIKYSGGGVGAVQWGTSGDIPVPGDYDGDGRTDIAVWRPSNGYWFIRYSGGGTGIVQWGASGDIPVPGKYDTDNKTDIAVWRPSSGHWFIQKSAGAVDIIQYGTSGDIPAPGDYDGNGSTDIAVFRPSNGYWFVKGQMIVQWGTSGDVPLIR